MPVLGAKPTETKNTFPLKLLRALQARTPRIRLVHLLGPVVPGLSAQGRGHGMFLEVSFL